jgi:hypothetical protein
MKIDKRIWKTGVLAIAITVFGSMFVMRLEEWSKGLNSEFIVYGQSGGLGGGGGTGTAGTITKVIPQIAVGSFDANVTKYSTTIQIVNTSATAVTLTGAFYKPVDGTPSALTFTTNISTVPSITGGVLSATSLPVNGVMIISGETASTGTVNWGKIQSTGSVSITTFFEIRNGAGTTLLSRVGVAASPANMGKFVIPRVRNVANGFETAFALVNTGSTAATITAVLRNANGVALATKALTMAAGTQTALFTNQFFGLTTEAAGTTYGFVTLESTSPQFAALALAFEGITITSFPVEMLN